MACPRDVKRDTLILLEQDAHRAISFLAEPDPAGGK